MPKLNFSRTIDKEICEDESLSSDYSITKKITFYSRNDLSKNLTYDDCNEILQVYSIQQSKIYDQLQCYTGNMKITIKDKANPQINQDSLQLLKQTFDALLIYTKQQKRLRLLHQEIQKNTQKRCMKEVFHRWKQFTNRAKLLTLKKKDEYKLQDMKKIESFIEAINNRQKCLKQEYKSKNFGNSSTDNAENDHINKKNHQQSNYLEANKKIIAEQRMKLAEQNRIIEEMKLKKIQAESKLAEIETLNAVNGAITNCNGRSRKILSNLIKARKENKTEDLVENTVNTPHFLIRMEARAAMRREQIQRRNEERKTKVEQQLKLEQAMKIDEEKRRKKFEKESREKAKQLKAQQEEAKRKRLEKIRVQNELADNFYRRYLLKSFGIRPFIQYLQLMKKQYNNRIMKKMFLCWKYNTDKQINEKSNFYENIYEQKLLKNNFQSWRILTINRIERRRTIEKHYSSRLQKYFFSKWISVTVSLKIVNIENYRKAENFDNNKTMSRYFKLWRKYIQVLDKIKDSDKRKSLLRQLVLTVIPDFAPEVRGVCIDD
ncbi:coiled-coil domain-containing protein 191-like [Chelonus insularis]|uniref:coiled-coil domain-containing protein 191-like n=1 Tax=Chelonus insularis TaxID=460826 RepID=UPI00158B72FE|nr:coiled-coil domain-containing protein 191-like [Chelonus insularis]